MKNIQQLTKYRKENNLIAYDKFGRIISLKCIHCGKELLNEEERVLPTKRYCSYDCQRVFNFNKKYNVQLKTLKDIDNYKIGNITKQQEILENIKESIKIKSKWNCVYRFKNIYGEIIYIGKVKNLTNRLQNHEHLSDKCYKERVRVEYIEFVSEDDAKFAEKYYISKNKPKYNKIDVSTNITITLNELDNKEWKIL